MSAHYRRLAFTPEVQAEQERHDSRRFYARRLAVDGEDDGDLDPLTPDVRAYVAQRDSFYLASIGSTGWPYVQFRGGPPGFLVPLDDHTVGWAEFQGNLQYTSTGNVAGDARVALIVMDYVRQRRLKIFGRARYLAPEDDPNLATRLIEHTYDAVVESLVVVEVAAFDWNGPQHITPRYTNEEFRAVIPIAD